MFAYYIAYYYILLKTFAELLNSVLNRRLC